MGGSRAARRHLSIIKNHYEIVGHMFKGEAKNVIENKGKSNRVIKNIDTLKKNRVACRELWGIVKNQKNVLQAQS